METVNVSFDPTNFPGVHIDTYGVLHGDSAIENTVEYLTNELGIPADHDVWGTFPFEFDHDGVVKAFADASWEFVSDVLGDVLVSAEIVSTDSPREYNFTSDSYEVEAEVDIAALREATPGFDLREYVAEHWESRSGFVSFVPGRCEREGWSDTEETGLRMRIESLVRERLDPSDYDMHMFEYEHEAWDENTTFTPELQKLCDEAWGKHYAEAWVERQTDSV